MYIYIIILYCNIWNQPFSLMKCPHGSGMLRASAPPLAAFSRRPGAHGTSFHGLSGRFTRGLASYLSEKQW